MQDFNPMTFADIAAWLETPEGMKYSDAVEFQFRRGFYYGAGAILDALFQGSTRPMGSETEYL